MIRTFNYPLHPTGDQVVVLSAWLRQCQQLYNAALQERISSWRKLGKSITRYDQQKSLTIIRSEDPEVKEVPALILRSALHRLDLAYKAFFRRVKSGAGKAGFPRYRSWDRYDSFGLEGPTTIEPSRVKIPKLGWIKFNEYRPIRGKILDVKVRRSGLKWTVSFQVDLGQAPAKVAPTSCVGIDVGLTHFATLSTGEHIPNPRFYQQGQDLLARRQRALASKSRGSNNRRKAKRLVAKAHSSIKNQRLNHARHVAKELVNRFDVIAFEDLNIKGMTHGNLGKSINDAGWGVLLQVITCKAEEAGKWAIGVDPRGTSQRCSSCSEVVKKDLSQRQHMCPKCGLVIDRDHNAGINISTLGWSVVLSELAGTSKPRQNKSLDVLGKAARISRWLMGPSAQLGIAVTTPIIAPVSKVNSNDLT